jgi:hypothetical protein
MRVASQNQGQDLWVRRREIFLKDLCSKTELIVIRKVSEIDGLFLSICIILIDVTYL